MSPSYGSQNSLWRQSLDNDSYPHLVGNLGSEKIAAFTLSADEKTFVFIRGRWLHEAVLIAGLK
jgi:hypothetical protein